MNADASAHDTESSEDEEEYEEPPQTGLWDLSRETTHERETSALACVWRAYINSSIAHGFAKAASNEAIVEGLARTEAHLRERAVSRVTGARESVRALERRNDDGCDRGGGEVDQNEATAKQPIAARKTMTMTDYEARDVEIVAYLKMHRVARFSDLVSSLREKNSMTSRILKSALKRGVIVHNGVPNKYGRYGLPGETFASVVAGKSLATVVAKPRRAKAAPAFPVARVKASPNGRGDPSKWGHATGVAALEERIAALRSELAGLEQALSIVRGVL